MAPQSFDVKVSPTATLQFECDWNVGIGGSLWTSGLLLVDYLSRHGSQYNLKKSQKFVELGSGTGLVGLAIATMGSTHSKVILTDDASHLDTLRSNTILNENCLVSNVSVEELLWGVTDTTHLFPVDMIVGTDVAYSYELYEPLISTFNALCNEKTVIILGISRMDTGLKFFERLIEENYVYYKIPEEDVGEEYRGKDGGIFIITKEKPLHLYSST